MKTKKIYFTGVGKAELLEAQLPALTPTRVLTRTLYTGISSGTERANIMDMPNTYSHGKWPKAEGYSACAIVEEAGSGVSSVKPGDRVLVYHGAHAYNWVTEEKRIVKIKDDRVDSLSAAFAIIASFPLGGIRKMDVGIGETGLVMGLGTLGILAVQLLKINGACPVIAADIREDRREYALSIGADYAFNPADPDFPEQVKKASGSGKGANAVVEVTGIAKALVTSLGCCAPFARIALLGCTRVSDASIDFYTQIHRPGIQLIGAHTDARPQIESSPHMWTDRDDQEALIRLMATGRLRIPVKPENVYKPEDAPKVYTALSYSSDFPIFNAFDWQ